MNRRSRSLALDIGKTELHSEIKRGGDEKDGELQDGMTITRSLALCANKVHRERLLVRMSDCDIVSV